jgi:hypothetical protein
MHRILSRALKVAVQRGKAIRNVCLLIDASSVQGRDEPRPLAADDVSRVLTAARWS